MLTRKQIQEKTGISAPMFEFYRRLDLIPGPVKTVRFKGKGSASYYEDRVARDINAIKNLQRRGWSLKQIKDLVREKKKEADSHISVALAIVAGEVEKALKEKTWEISKKQKIVDPQTGKTKLSLEITEK